MHAIVMLNLFRPCEEDAFQKICCVKWCSEMRYTIGGKEIRKKYIVTIEVEGLIILNTSKKKR